MYPNHMTVIAHDVITHGSISPAATTCVSCSLNLEKQCYVLHLVYGFCCGLMTLSTCSTTTPDLKGKGCISGVSHHPRRCVHMHASIQPAFYRLIFAVQSPICAYAYSLETEHARVSSCHLGVKLRLCLASTLHTIMVMLNVSLPKLWQGI